MNMILEDDTPLHVNNPRKIRRKHGGVVVSEPDKKENKFVFKKRRLMEDVDSFPYGYNKLINLLYTYIFYFCRYIYLCHRSKSNYFV